MHVCISQEMIFCSSLIYCLHMYTFILISIYYPVISFIYKFAKLCFFSTVLNILKMCSYQKIVILGFVGNEQSPRKMCNKIDQSVKQLLGAKCTFVMKITFKTNFRLQQCTIYLFFFLTVYGLTFSDLPVTAQPFHIVCTLSENQINTFMA